VNEKFTLYISNNYRNVFKKIIRRNGGMMNRKLKARIFLKFGTQADFAQAIGEYRSVVSEVVRGRRELSDHKQIEWAMALGCQPIDVFPKQPISFDPEKCR